MVTGTYLYAVCRPIDPARLAGLRGVGSAPVRVLEGEGVCLVVGSVSMSEFGEVPLHDNLGNLQWLERTAREHDAVIHALAELTTTAPLRMATVCSDDEAARGRLHGLAERAGPVLDRLDGRVEWGVKVFGAEPAVDADSGSGSGADYLRRRRDALAEREQRAAVAAERAAELYEELACLAVAGRRHRPHDSRLSGVAAPMLLNAAFLVDHTDSTRFRSLARTLADGENAVRIELTGPWPPYSFAVLDETCQSE